MPTAVSLEEMKNKIADLETGHNNILLNMQDLKAKLDTNTTDTKAIKENTDFLVTLFSGAKAGARLIILLGKIAKWVGGIAIAVTATWTLVAAFKTGIPPSLPK